jgi:hypothetical protein
MTSLAEANRIVQEELGKDWRMAEFHDGGGGWHFWGVDSIPDDSGRFWVHINDQPANCWSKVTRRN